MAKEHVECNTGLEVLHHKVEELYHRIYKPKYPNYEVKR